MVFHSLPASDDQFWVHHTKKKLYIPHSIRSLVLLQTIHGIANITKRENCSIRGSTGSCLMVFEQYMIIFQIWTYWKFHLFVRSHHIYIYLYKQVLSSIHSRTSSSLKNANSIQMISVRKRLADSRPFKPMNFHTVYRI